MSIGHHAGNRSAPTVVSAESMYEAILQQGIVPFFENAVPGYSIEEMTPPAFWFDGEEGGLGPWDWKIDCLRSGDIVYGKYLCGGKASFATVPWYRELRNYRQSLPKYQPAGSQLVILDYLSTHGSVTIREVRQLLGIKKSAADALMTKLQMQCRVVLGDMTRVYNGEDLSYKGWQVASFCRPEDLFGASDSIIHSPADSSMASPFRTRSAFPSDPVVPVSELTGSKDMPVDFPFGAAFEASENGLETTHSPEESLELLVSHLSELTGCTDRRLLLKVLG